MNLYRNACAAAFVSETSKKSEWRRQVAGARLIHAPQFAADAVHRAELQVQPYHRVPIEVARCPGLVERRLVNDSYQYEPTRRSASSNAENGCVVVLLFF